MTPAYESWGRFPKVKHSPLFLDSRFSDFPDFETERNVLPYGIGRSYGDSCLNDKQYILPMAELNRFISFDRSSGILMCEAGMSFEHIIKYVLPQGWFLPVTPGTKFVTVGGAIANDIHGKNHHCDGTFGHHLLRFELLRSNGQRLLCSPTQNAPYFDATIGGLGLTGVITWAEFKLKPVFNPFITQEVIRFQNLDEFFVLSEESERDFVYTVSWVDCVAKGKGLGRGLFIRGNHASSMMNHVKNFESSGSKSVPIDFPGWALNSLSVKIFNSLYYRKQVKAFKRNTISYDPFFYPLDSIHHWNRIYGKRGFLQWQCVVPFVDGRDAIHELLGRIAKSGYGSFLAVLKTFGKIPALGMLSFPREGVTLALDFPMAGPKLFKLLEELDGIVGNSGGAIYPAKDARMSPASFQKFFPRIEKFLQYKDPKFSSSFWRRVHLTK